MEKHFVIFLLYNNLEIKDRDVAWLYLNKFKLRHFVEVSIDEIFRKQLSRWLIHIDPIIVVVHDTILISKEIRAVKTNIY